MRLDPLGVEDIFIAEANGLEDKGLEYESYEVGGGLSLDEALAALVKIYAAVLYGGGNYGVLDGCRAVIAALENVYEHLLLVRRQFIRETCSFSHMVGVDIREGAAFQTEISDFPRDSPQWQRSRQMRS